MKRSISRRLLELHSSSNPIPEGTITCPICQATYAPSLLHTYLLQNSLVALESAFMSMCHFCFRCRRPSCPNCWDNVHGVCGQCAHETHIPFRRKLPPLIGTSHFSSHVHLSPDAHSTPSSHVSVQPGHYQQLLSSSIDSISTWPDRPAILYVRSHAQSVGTSGTSSSVAIDKIKTRPDPDHPRDIDRIETRPDRNRSLDIDMIETHPDHTEPLNIDKIKTHPDHRRSPHTNKLETHLTSSIIGKQKLVCIVTTLLLFLLFLLVIVIATVFVSMDANQFIYNVMHIDIRTELISLWHFLSHLF